MFKSSLLGRRSRCLSLIASLLAMMMLAAPVQAEEGAGDIFFNGEYWNGYWQNPLRILTSPAQWSEDDLLRNGAIAAGVIGLFALDKTIKRVSQNNRSSTTDGFADVGQPFGNNRYLLGGLGVTYAAALAIDDEKLQETSLLGFESWAVAAAFSEGLKWTTGRIRPDDSSDSMNWNFFKFDKSNTSFPSGHATSAFAVATSFASAYEDDWVMQVVPYGLATLASWSRVNDNRHWGSDVFIGAALGFGVAKLVHASDPFRRRRGMEIKPLASSDSVGLGLAFKF